ncbi:MAG: hypothetical protein ACJ8CB_24290 [Ktedonobacteraceae bacterium]
MPAEDGGRRVERVSGVDRLMVGPDGLDEFIARCPAVCPAQEYLQQSHRRSPIAPLAPCHACVTRRLFLGPRGSTNQPLEGEFPERGDPHQRMLCMVVFNCAVHRQPTSSPGRPASSCKARAEPAGETVTVRHGRGFSLPVRQL